MATGYLRPDCVRANPTLQSVPRSVLLRQMTQACELHDIPPTRFGREAVGDPCLVFDIRAGRQPGARLQRRILAYINELAEKAHGHA